MQAAAAAAGLFKAALRAVFWYVLHAARGCAGKIAPCTNRRGRAALVRGGGDGCRRDRGTLLRGSQHPIHHFSLALGHIYRTCSAASSSRVADLCSSMICRERETGGVREEGRARIYSACVLYPSLASCLAPLFFQGLPFHAFEPENGGGREGRGVKKEVAGSPCLFTKLQLAWNPAELSGPVPLHQRRPTGPS